MDAELEFQVEVSVDYKNNKYNKSFLFEVHNFLKLMQISQLFFSGSNLLNLIISCSYHSHFNKVPLLHHICLLTITKCNLPFIVQCSVVTVIPGS